MSIQQEDSSIEKLGPLKALAGTWEGSKGDDIAPSSSRGKEQNAFREKMIFEPIGQVDNHEQTLFGLRYRTTAWKLGADQPFHEEVGYWLWDEKNKQVMRCFIVPRGVSIIAGGTTEKDATSFTMKADLGSPTYGICSNIFLDREFKTTHYQLKIDIHSQESFSYNEETWLSIPTKEESFLHTDRNTMTRVLL